MIDLLANIALVILAFLIVLAVGLAVMMRAMWTWAHQETGPRDPVPPELLDRIVRQGGYDIGKDRQPNSTERWEAWGQVI